jgi:uncharacterized protein
LSTATKPRIYIDADSCPVKDETYKVAKRNGLDVVLVAAQWLRIPTESWITLEVVKDGGQLDAADDWIVEHAVDEDIVITEDILLAERCLENNARVVSPRSRVFTPESIGEAIAMRELMETLRQTGEVTGGAAPFDKRDRSTFLQRLDELVQLSLRALSRG